METITLTRTSREGNAVHGSLTLPFSLWPVKDGEKDITVKTLENAGFIIPAGTYPLEKTWSPKFRKELPLVGNVPGREGIRIHMGTKPEHSEGCILTDYYGACCIDAFLNRLKNIYDEEVSICITDLPDAHGGVGR